MRIVMLVLAAFTINLMTWAHNYVPDPGNTTGPDNAIVIEDITLSQVAYHNAETGSAQLWLAMEGKAGQDLYVQLGVPVIERLTDSRPSLAVIGPGFPEVASLPFDIPSGMGALLYPTVGMPLPDVYEEHFTGTRDWIYVEDTLILPADGRYYVVAFDPSGQPARFWTAIGTREAFTLRAIAEIGQVVTDVRVYHEVEDEPLPLLPRMMTWAGWLVRFFFWPWL